MNKHLLLLFMLFFLWLTAFAQDLRLSPETVITQEQIKQIRQLLPTLKEDTQYYHWTNAGNAIRWVEQGKMDAGEVAFMNTPTGHRQVYGAGVYLAADPFSSNRFGDVPTSFKIAKGTPLYDEKIVKQVLKKELSAAEASVLGETIPYLRDTGDGKGWFVFNNPEHAREIKYAKVVNPEARIKQEKFYDTFEFSKTLSNSAQSGDSAYLKNLVTSFEFMDGVAVPAAMETSPQAPWNMFSGHELGNFQNTLSPEFAESLKNKISPQGYLVDSKVILDDALPSIYASLSGEGKKPLSELVRSEGVRAGGDETGKRFLATEKQLNELLSNPYLEVVSEKQPNGQYLVEYFYPDAFHFKKLKEKLPEDLYQKLSSLNPDELMNNHELRQRLNKEIIQSLLKDLFDKANKNKIPATLMTDRYLQFNRDFISIHPFNDFNGRTTRILSRVATDDGHMAHYFFSDMDLLNPISEQKALLVKGSRAITNLRTNLLEEFLIAKSEKRMPDYKKTKAFDQYIFEAGFSKQYVDVSNPKVVEDIQKRRWPTLFEKAQADFEKGFFKLMKDKPLAILNSPETKSLALESLQKSTLTHFDEELLKNIVRSLKSTNEEEYTSALDLYKTLFNGNAKQNFTIAGMSLEGQKDFLAALEDLLINSPITNENVYLKFNFKEDYSILYNKLLPNAQAEITSPKLLNEKFLNSMAQSFPKLNDNIRLQLPEIYVKMDFPVEEKMEFMKKVFLATPEDFEKNSRFFSQLYKESDFSLIAQSPLDKKKEFLDYTKSFISKTAPSKKAYSIDFSSMAKRYEEIYQTVPSVEQNNITSPKDMRREMQRGILTFSSDLGSELDSRLSIFESTSPSDVDKLYHANRFLMPGSTAKNPNAAEELIRKVRGNYDNFPALYEGLSAEKKIDLLTEMQKTVSLLASSGNAVGAKYTLETYRNLYAKTDINLRKTLTPPESVLAASVPSAKDCVSDVLKKIFSF